MSTPYEYDLQDFRDVVRLMPGHYKEVYIRYGVRHWWITDKTAEKRLNDALNEKDSRIFETIDPLDGRRKRVYHRATLRSKPRIATISIGGAMALNEIAVETLKNCLKWSSWEDRLRGFSASLQAIRGAMLQLEECVAESKGRNKYATEKGQLQRTLMEIRSCLESDPDYDKMLPLLATGLIPPHPYSGAVRVLQTKHFAMDKLPNPEVLARRTPERSKIGRL